MVVGLGNPGAAYAKTRHNVGFELIDRLAAAHSIPLNRRRARAKVGRGTIAGHDVLLVQPQTFMNLSGVAVAALAQQDGVALEDILVVCDDIRLPVGRLRMRAQGSSGGQNGLKSVAESLGSEAWPRLRLGVGEPPAGLQIEWVLSRFAASDRAVIDQVLIVAMGAVEVWLAEGVELAMTRFNGQDVKSDAVQ